MKKPHKGFTGLFRQDNNVHGNQRILVDCCQYYIKTKVSPSNRLDKKIERI